MSSLQQLSSISKLLASGNHQKSFEITVGYISYFLVFRWLLCVINNQ